MSLEGVGFKGDPGAAASPPRKQWADSGRRGGPASIVCRSLSPQACRKPGPGSSRPHAPSSGERIASTVACSAASNTAGCGCAASASVEGSRARGCAMRLRDCGGRLRLGRARHSRLITHTSGTRRRCLPFAAPESIAGVTLDEGFESREAVWMQVALSVRGKRAPRRAGAGARAAAGSAFP